MDNPGIRHAQCLHNEDIANGRDIDDQRITLSLERHNNRIVATAEHMYMYRKMVCYAMVYIYFISILLDYT